MKFIAAPTKALGVDTIHLHVAGRSKQGTRGLGTGDRGPGTEDRGPGTEDQDPVLDPFFCMGGCGTHIAITSAKHQDFALHCRIHLCSYS